MNTAPRQHVTLSEALDALERLSFGQISEDDLERLHSLTSAHLHFVEYAGKIYAQRAKECEEKGWSLDYDVSHYNIDSVTVMSAETLPQSSTPRYEFEATYHEWADGSGGRWVCVRKDNWIETP